MKYCTHWWFTVLIPIIGIQVHHHLPCRPQRQGRLSTIHPLHLYVSRLFLRYDMIRELISLWKLRQAQSSGTAYRSTIGTKEKHRSETVYHYC